MLQKEDLTRRYFPGHFSFSCAELCTVCTYKTSPPGSRSDGFYENSFAVTFGTLNVSQGIDPGVWISSDATQDARSAEPLEGEQVALERKGTFVSFP